ncbi:cupin domain-containing protein [Candidatus Venteria ishoeyi]|uniref:cupin domain-containing protein n=1 Tax=Candidatus Venteria ishoeyi TaxID=1899563 RepID=UPI0025A4D33F|nr:cupin domain-containing protein [Candidatus Venteria ishoeyi]MDM8546657.1 cupin domain-containing protein [Candidatus Venteria ishoeyi]
MQPTIKQNTQTTEYYIPEGCYITELSNSNDDPALSIARARVEPGVTTQWHRLKGTVERYLILEGEGLVEVGTMPAQAVSAGDVVIIPAQCQQRIRNMGQQDLIFLAMCTPRFLPEVYENLESI